MSAVPPAIGRIVSSSGSNSLIASESEVGSASSNGLIGLILAKPTDAQPPQVSSLQRRDAQFLGRGVDHGALFVDRSGEFRGGSEIEHLSGQREPLTDDRVAERNLDVGRDALAQSV